MKANLRLLTDTMGLSKFYISYVHTNDAFIPSISDPFIIKIKAIHSFEFEKNMKIWTPINFKTVYILNC